MITKSYDLVVDIMDKSNNDVPTNIEVVQGDYKTNILNITLTEDSTPVNLTNLTVTIAFKKADGTVVVDTTGSDTMSIVSATAGTIRCILRTQSISYAGDVIATVGLTSSINEKITSTEFKFKVRESIDNGDALESTNDIPILTNMISTVQNLETTVETAETTRVSQESARQSFYNEFRVFEAYSGTKAYKVGNKVTYNDEGYYCLQNCTGVIPTNTSYWIRFAAKGAVGQTGSTGATGATGVGLNYNWIGTQLGVKREDEGSYQYTNLQGIQGLRGLNWKNTAYSSSTTYYVDDALKYGKNSYRCIVQSLGHPPTDTNYWAILAEGGADGAGTGNMNTATYDTDNDGKVDSAEYADSAGTATTATTATSANALNGKTASGTLTTVEQTNLVTAINEVLVKANEGGGSSYTLPVATTTKLGGVLSGTDITVDGSGNVSVVNNSHTHLRANITDFPTTFTPPVATSTVLGGVKSGTDITVDGSGNVSVVDNSHSHTKANISDFPTIPTTATQINVTDANSHFTASTVEGVLDELFQSANDGKTSVANVIGSPTVATETFTQITTDIQTQKTNLATNLTAKGQSSTGTETLKALVDKVANINTGYNVSDATAVAGDIMTNKTAYITTGKVTGTGTNVKRRASGHVTGLNIVQNGTYTVSGLEFIPKSILINKKNSGVSDDGLIHASAYVEIIGLGYSAWSYSSSELRVPSQPTGYSFTIKNLSTYAVVEFVWIAYE